MKNLKKGLSYALYFVLATVLFTACADVSPHVDTCITSNSYGFFGGLWHGIILPISWIGSLFSDDIAIYAYNNTGVWYDFGFAIGVGAVFGGGGRSTKSK